MTELSFSKVDDLWVSSAITASGDDIQIGIAYKDMGALGRANVFIDRTLDTSAGWSPNAIMDRTKGGNYYEMTVKDAPEGCSLRIRTDMEPASMKYQ